MFKAILTTPSSVLPQLLDPVHRACFSKPVTVRVLYSDLQGLTWVEDPTWGRFPTDPSNLRWADGNHLAGRSLHRTVTPRWVIRGGL